MRRSELACISQQRESHTSDAFAGASAWVARPVLSRDRCSQASSRAILNAAASAQLLLLLARLRV